MAKEFKIVLLARDGELSNSTLKYLAGHYTIAFALIERRTAKKEMKTYINTQGYGRFLFLLLKIALKKTGLISSSGVSPETLCNRNNIKYEIVNSHNSKRSLEILHLIKPDIIVICAARIISKKVIETTKTGILNGHPGWLPDYRGWDALRWSVYYKKNIGVTVHFIDDGVDTGPIICRERIDHTGYRSFPKLYQFALERRLFLYKTAIENIIKNDHQTIIQKPGEGKRYYRMGIFKMCLVNFILFFNYKKSRT